MNLVPRTPGVTLRVGDEVEVLDDPADPRRAATLAVAWGP